MAISPTPIHHRLLSLLLLVLITADVTYAKSSSSSELVSELLSLQSQSQNGIIRLNDHLVSRFLTSTKNPRPFSLLIFFDAVQLHDKPELRLQDLRREFSILSSSFISNNPESTSLFFCDLEFKESQSSFSLFGVNSLPHIRLVDPDVKSLKDSDQMDQGDFSRLAESMSDFVESKTKLTVGTIHRPPLLTRTQMMIMAGILLISLPFFIKKLLSAKTLLHDPKIWLTGAVFVYFFSVSGTMHNVIRKMPMFLMDRNDPNKLIFFYQGSGMQLGAEGFAIGFLYTIVGLLLALVTQLLVRVRNATVQRTIMIVALLVSFLAVRQVVYLDNWKTGYAVHAFLPASWR